MTPTGTLAQMQGISRQRELHSGKDDTAVGRSVSFTLTIEEPEKAAWFEQKTAKMSPAELGVLVVALLSQKLSRVDGVSRLTPAMRTATKTAKHRLSGLLKPDAPLPADWDYHTLLDERARERYGVSWM